MSEVFSVLGMLLTVGLVLVLAYLCTRYLAGHGLNLPRTARSGQLLLLDQLSLGKDQRLVLVQVGTRYLLLGVAPSSVTLVSELTEEQAGLWQTQTTKDDVHSPVLNFRDAFLDAMNRFKK